MFLCVQSRSKLQNREVNIDETVYSFTHHLDCAYWDKTFVLNSLLGLSCDLRFFFIRRQTILVNQKWSPLYVTIPISLERKWGICSKASFGKKTFGISAFRRIFSTPCLLSTFVISSLCG